jgi:hypothetical protein
MVIILSAGKRDIRGHKDQTLFGKTIQLSTEVQYLGLTFDKRLTWKKQLDKVTNKANTAFWTCRCMFRKMWGLRPMVFHWVHTMVVRPTVNYTANV